MGKFSRSWELVKESFAILRSDKQLMLFPVLSAVSCLIVTIIIGTGGAVAVMPAIASAAANGERFNPNQSPLFLLAMFAMYVASNWLGRARAPFFSGRSSPPLWASSCARSKNAWASSAAS
jgi:hypothetical protein